MTLVEMTAAAVVGKSSCS